MPEEEEVAPVKPQRAGVTFSGSAPSVHTIPAAELEHDGSSDEAQNITVS